VDFDGKVRPVANESQSYGAFLNFIGRILGDRRTRGVFALFVSVMSVRAAVQAIHGQYEYTQTSKVAHYP
jgi:hypothetical protein